MDSTVDVMIPVDAEAARRSKVRPVAKRSVGT